MDARNFTVINALPGEGEIDLAALVASRPDSALAALLAAADLVLAIDEDGGIDQLHIGGGDLDAADLASWEGRAWIDTALPDSRGKIEAMLAEGSSPRWREANHAVASGELPLKWLTLALPGGRRLAIARDQRAAASLQQRLVRAQQAMERDSIRLRQLEARHRLLFETAAEAIFIIDAGSRRVLEANAAARRATGRSAAALDGENFAALVHPDDHDSSIALLGALTASEQRHPARLRLAGGQAFQMSASLFRQDRENRLMLRLHPLEPAAAPSAEPLADAMERIPDPFVLTDDNFDIIAGNGAFLDLVGLARPADVVGQPIGRYLGRPGLELGVLVAALRDHGMVRGFATVVRPGHGDASDGESVEVSAVSSGEAGGLRHGFAIRVAARDQALTPPTALPMSQLTELVGRVSLKEIVRESTDLIERLCIEAALTYTDDNRASAAEILGLSRQSLYSKLHRHGLGNLGLGNLGDNDSSNDNG
ncbi:transcriptional regulator PpsR [Sandarakinorhabdus oryzae]|uniref:transcriptional regulator PpsR n=1 Tax=Sandarakinorhabdus oryzae TaxID=2675220 RepID=UPI0012E18B55|nr:transcriptional regulator PpsR [Sandarakinorhabdus oryzae]